MLFVKKRTYFVEDEAGSIAEGIPQVRDNTLKAWVSIMYGCNNFCTYCIVPYVRGRERSRKHEDILAECRQLIESGIKDITLLGQNVNSYGKDLDEGIDFADLLALIAEIPGDFRIRFISPMYSAFVVTSRSFAESLSRTLDKSEITLRKVAFIA